MNFGWSSYVSFIDILKEVEERKVKEKEMIVVIKEDDMKLLLSFKMWFKIFDLMFNYDDLKLEWNGEKFVFKVIYMSVILKVIFVNVFIW